MKTFDEIFNEVMNQYGVNNWWDVFDTCAYDAALYLASGRNPALGDKSPLSACDDDKTVKSIYQLLLAWTLMGSDLGLIILSYALILQSVLKLNSAEAASKALSTCTSHLILILFFYTVIIGKNNNIIIFSIKFSI